MRVVACCCVCVCMGCLVTDRIEYQEEANRPPTIRDKGIPIGFGDLLRVDTGSTEEIRFEVDIRDPNAGQELHARVKRTTAPQGSTLEEIDVAPSARDFEFVVEVSDLEPGHCYRLELAVSSDFAATIDLDNDWAVPETPGDVAIVNWWIFEVSGGEPFMQESCPGGLNTSVLDDSVEISP